MRSIGTFLAGRTWVLTIRTSGWSMARSTVRVSCSLRRVSIFERNSRPMPLRWAAFLLLFAHCGIGAQNSSVETLSATAARQIQEGNYRAAAATLRGSLKQYPSEIGLLNLLGIAETELHDRAAAINAF